MKAVFLFGLAGTGKDTVAALMMAAGLEKVTLADPIREEYTRRTGRTDHKKNRDLMIRIGEGYKEIYGQDVWCDQAVREIERIESHTTPKPTGYVITDGRYQHEYDYFVNERGFIPLLLVADEDVRRERLAARDGTVQEQSLQFESQNFIVPEREVYTIENNGNLYQLAHEVRWFLNCYQIRQEG